MESVSFQASLKGLNTKPDGIEVKLKTATVDGVLLRELAPMMLQAFLDVTIEPPIRQHELPFSGTMPFAGAKEPPAAREAREAAEDEGTSEAPANAEPAEETTGPEKTDDASLTVGSARVGNVEWVLGCSVGDVNYEGALTRLTDDELLYCLKCETRKTGRSRLRAEARRRGLKVGSDPVTERDTEDGAEARRVAFF